MTTTHPPTARELRSLAADLRLQADAAADLARDFREPSFDALSTVALLLRRAAAVVENHADEVRAS